MTRALRGPAFYIIVRQFFLKHTDILDLRFK